MQLNVLVGNQEQLAMLIAQNHYQIGMLYADNENTCRFAQPCISGVSCYFIIDRIQNG
jgi:hypothetical protein